MQKQEFIERMERHNRHQMKLNEEMIEILEMQIKVFKSYNNKVLSLIQHVQNNNIPPALSNSMLDSFADLRNNYHHFFTQCSEILIKQIRINKASTNTLSREYTQEY